MPRPTLPPWFAATAAALLLGGCGSKKEPEGKAPPAPAPAKPPAPVKPAGPPPPLPALAEDPGTGDGAPRWGVSIGGLGADVAWDLAADATGGAVACGLFEQDATFPAPIGKRTAQASDAYVMAVGGDGEARWLATAGGPNEDTCDAVAVGHGLVVAGGLFSESIAIGDMSARSNGSDDLWVGAWRADTGAPAWLWATGSKASDSVLGLAPAPDGGFVAVGGFFGDVDFGATPLKAAGFEDPFVVKLTADGDVAWARRFGGDRDDRFTRVVVDAQGSIYALGAFEGKATFGAETLEAAGGYDIVLVKLDRAGEPVWAKRFGGIDNDNGVALAVDPAGNVTFVGSFDQTIQVGEQQHKAAGTGDVLVARIGADGAVAWSRAFGGKGEDVAAGVAADAAGNVIVSGWFEHDVDFGAGTVSSAGNKDVFVAKLDRAGATRWVKTWGDRDHDKARGAAVTPDGHVFVAGIYRFTMKLPTPLDSVRDPADKAPKTDAFLLHLER